MRMSQAQEEMELLTRELDLGPVSRRITEQTGGLLDYMEMPLPDRDAERAQKRADIWDYVSRTDANPSEWSEADRHLRTALKILEEETTAFQQLALRIREARIRDASEEALVARIAALRSFREGRVDVSGYPVAHSSEWKAAVTAARLSSLERTVGRLTERFCDVFENTAMGYNDNTYIVEGLLNTADLLDPPEGDWPDVKADAEKYLQEVLLKKRET
jgi:hypothetical protein